MTLTQARLYGILDTGWLSPDHFPGMARKLILGGAGILQVRAKGADTATIVSLGQSVMEVCHELKVPLIINDDIDAALAIPGAGLHIGQDDIAPLEAREKLGPARVLGLSTHSEAQASHAASLGQQKLIDYFAVGPVFPTLTKPDYTPVTLDLVHWTLEQRFSTPHFFIGGIRRDNLPRLTALGPCRVVIVSALIQADDPEAETRACLDLLSH